MAVYAIVSGKPIWPELEEPRDWEEIKKRIVKRRFPDTDVGVEGSTVWRKSGLRLRGKEMLLYREMKVRRSRYPSLPIRIFLQPVFLSLAEFTQD